jgi:hypothetical protein
MRDTDLGGGEATAFDADPQRFIDDAHAEFNRQLASFQDSMEPDTVAAIRAKFEKYLRAYVDALRARRQARDNPEKSRDLGSLRAIRILGDHG